ncbi:WYL domain-containing protein [Alteromonas macleodii]|uniref:WYL domain-containing protein n=1 Tax=Alteromonas macleodii TaxID=28108 RepID=UPI0022B0505B|nr:WYL domain-containing protein [Alteromonas macleodii]MCZ4239645.1 WYL domain-containing protein [Alteromonas macleodii]
MELAQRYWMLELLAYWEGQINTKPLMRAFDISRQSASATINKYLASNEDTLVYDVTQKAYVVTETFNPTIINKTVDEYFDWQQAGKIPSFQPRKPSTNQARIQPLPRYVDPNTMRPLLKAMKCKTAVDCEYLSVTNNESIGRLFYPHSFVKAANRWHVRGFCALRNSYLDFVLSRFRSVEYDGAESVNTELCDVRWNTFVNLILAPDSRLSDIQKQALEKDFNMVDGRLVVKARGALVKYTLDDLQIKAKMLEADPQAQQLVCVNYSDIKRWLYE